VQCEPFHLSLVLSLFVFNVLLNFRLDFLQLVLSGFVVVFEDQQTFALVLKVLGIVVTVLLQSLYLAHGLSLILLLHPTI